MLPTCQSEEILHGEPRDADGLQQGEVRVVHRLVCRVIIAEGGESVEAHPHRAQQHQRDGEQRDVASYQRPAAGAYLGALQHKSMPTNEIATTLILKYRNIGNLLIWCAHHFQVSLEGAFYKNCTKKLLMRLLEGVPEQPLVLAQHARPEILD